MWVILKINVMEIEILNIERKEKKKKNQIRVFHRFGQAKFPDGGSVLGSSQFSIMPQLPLKMITC